MATYQHILLCIDLSDESDQVAARATAFRDGSSAKLSVIHIIEPLSFAYGGDIPMDFSNVQEEIHKQASKQLTAFSAKYAIAQADQHIAVGRAETEIHRFAEDAQVDLVVVGSHGRHGLALLLGSTANGVLHGAACDVLAVRVK